MSFTYVFDSWDGALARIQDVQKDDDSEVTQICHTAVWYKLLGHKGPSEWGAEFDALADKISFALWGFCLFPILFSWEESELLAFLFRIEFIFAITVGYALTRVRKLKKQRRVTTRSNPWGKIKVWVEWAAFSLVIATKLLPQYQLLLSFAAVVILGGALYLAFKSLAGHVRDLED